MKVKDVMSTPVVTAAPGTSFKKLCHLLLANDISGVPVVDDEDCLLGVVTEADLISHEAYEGHRNPLSLLAGYFTGKDPRWVRKAEALTARDLMSVDVAAAEPGEDIGVAARRMLERGVNRLPVVEHDRVVGLVTRHDLLTYFVPNDEEISAHLQSILDDPFNDPGRYDVAFNVHEGVAYLRGWAHFESDAKVLHRMVVHIPGVVDVVDEVDFREHDPHPGPFV